MGILFSLLPFVVSILVVITKKKVVNANSGEKFAIREMILDVFKVFIITVIALAANFLFDKKVPIWTLLIDVFMLIIYLLPLLQKNYDYAERKALMGIFAPCVFMLSIGVAIFQMLIGTYDKSDFTLFFCFTKGLSYFFIAIWCCFTVGKDNKLKGLISELKTSFLNYRISKLDYYALAFLELFIFTGGKGNFTPIGIFGFHEILNRNYFKGAVYIVLANVSLFLQWKYPFLGSISFIIYTFVAFLDLLIHFIKSIKK